MEGVEGEVEFVAVGPERLQSSKFCIVALTGPPVVEYLVVEQIFDHLLWDRGRPNAQGGVDANDAVAGALS